MRKTAIIIDDVEMNREMLSEILSDSYSIIQAENGKEGLELIDRYLPELAVILLDLVMPVMDGFEVLEELNRRSIVSTVPVLIISSETATAIERRCFGYGIVDFVRRPFDNMLVSRRVRNAADLYTAKYNLEETVAEQTEELRQKNEKLHRANVDITELMGTLVEARSLESGTHIRRVRGFTNILGTAIMNEWPEYGLTPEKLQIICEACMLHDVGKIMISDSVLLKPGKLTPEEFDLMKQHTVLGCHILEETPRIWEEEYYRCGYEICRHHHEKYDGRGYPDGLKGDEIPISAQIVSVADCFDALTTERVYKAAFTPEKAYSMIQNGECGAFSPKILQSFAGCFEQMKKLALENECVVK